jgi:hypothetical protein
MISLQTDPPGSEAEFRQALYGGAIFRLPATPGSRDLVTRTLEVLEEELGRDRSIREAQFRLGDAEFFEAVGRLRKKLYTEPCFHEAVRSLIRECGFDPARIAFDPIRLRVVTHKGFENPKAAPIYHAHRDTWYAHSQAEITWWVPLHDVTEDETFVFYPDYFRLAVDNNSEGFDHDRWTQHGASLRIGWQNPEDGIRHLYPGQVGNLEPGRVLTFAAHAGEIVLFAGAHFHQTRHNTTGRTRFSIDFRTVDLNDHQHGLGAPNVDNRSTGSAVRDYIHPVGRL